MDEIEEFKAFDESFAGPRPGYIRNDPSMTRICCEL